MTRRLPCLLLSASLLCFACAAPAAGEPSASSEDALTDFSTQAGIVGGSAEAAAVLAVANDPHLAKNDYVNTVGLTAATADAILHGRPFATLAQLNGLPGSSTVMFVKLQTYARSTGTQAVVHGADRSIALPDSANDAEVEQWGRGLWEGYISFDASLSGSEAITYDNARLVDAFGGSYGLTATSTHFARLPLPVRLLAKTDASGTTNVVLKNVTFEVTKTNPLLQQGLSDQFHGTDATTLTTIGQDIPGVQLTFTASATFHQNFTNGNACATLVIGAKTLTPASSSVQISATAPVTVTSRSTCISARLPQGQAENANDFDLQLSAITLGDPH